MDSSLIFLFALGVLSGFSVTRLGMGGGIYIVPLLPFLTGLSPLETMQLSFFLIFVITGINSIIFTLRKEVSWPFAKVIFPTSAGMSFFSNFFVIKLSSYQIRLVLWLCLGGIIAIPFIVKRSSQILKRLPYFSGILMGFCTGLTGIGGGTILSPILHESRLISVHKIPGTICVIMFPIAVFSLLAQGIGTQFPLSISSLWWTSFFIMFISSMLGFIIGYNTKFKSHKTSRSIVRILVLLMFLKVTGEVMNPLLN